MRILTWVVLALVAGGSASRIEGKGMTKAEFIRQRQFHRVCLRRQGMTVNTLWRLLVTLVCAGAIMALPQGSTAGGDPAGSGASAPGSRFKADDQTPGLTPYQDGYGSRGRYSSDGLIADK